MIPCPRHQYTCFTCLNSMRMTLSSGHTTTKSVKYNNCKPLLVIRNRPRNCRRFSERLACIELRVEWRVDDDLKQMKSDHHTAWEQSLRYLFSNGYANIFWNYFKRIKYSFRGKATNDVLLCLLFSMLPCAACDVCNLSTFFTIFESASTFDGLGSFHFFSGGQLRQLIVGQSTYRERLGDPQRDWLSPFLRLENG